MRAIVRAGIASATVSAIAASALAIDHNNLDAGRPLRFDDAYSIAFGERAFETGVSMDTFRRRASDFGFQTEVKYGFAKNQDIGIAFSPGYDGERRRFDANRVELSYFHGLRREIDDSPAIGYKVEVGLPTGRDTEGIEAHFRAIATKSLRQYDKVHLNLDAIYASEPEAGERQVAFGAILGYSTPLGYPKRFDQTLVAEFAVQQSAMKGKGATGTVGLGLRRQIGVRSVFDIGLESDIFAPAGTPKGTRLVIGFSASF